MKNIHSKFLFGAALLSSFAVMSCSDNFLEEKKNYDNISSEVYDYYEGVDGRINDLYYWCSPNVQASRLWQFPSMRLKDEQSQSTEEYAGFGNFVNPQVTMNTLTGSSQAPEYFQGTSAYSMNASTWGRIRNVNDAIIGITNGSLSQSEKDIFLGQAYFLRAWCYYYLVRYYGGVPIIEEVLEASSSSARPRNTTKECLDFICADLDKAASLLGSTKWSGTDYGRVDAAAALALKGRVLLLWASPLFNRDNDTQRWQDAYDFMKEALPKINALGYSLGHASSPGVNASGWAQMFLDLANNPEGVWVTLYNRTVPDLAPDYQRNNTWEQAIRPANTLGNNGQTPSAMIVDLFPMSDGKRPSTYKSYTNLSASSIEYDAEHPFMNRDPRFYRTFAFPGVKWQFSGDPNTSTTVNPYTGENYILWNYVWYNDKTLYDNATSSDAYGADNLLKNAHGMYIRKFSDDYQVNSTPNYNFSTTGKSVGFRCCESSTMEIRYAEVLLNLAEAACMTNNLSEAVGYLKQIRQRVGYTGDCGLDASLSGNQAACMSAILYERQIEFAYEGKRFEDMRRWLLFDGGANFESAGLKKLTGWGGNTCTWLGVTPFNNQRRENLEFRLQDKYNYSDTKSGAEWTFKKTTDDPYSDITNPDPLIGQVFSKTPVLTRETRDAYALDLSKDLAGQDEKLKEFYDTYLVRKTKLGDGYDSSNTLLYTNFLPRYYILGLTSAAQSNNPTMEQTMGWEDSQNGGANGTFDPLAE